MCDFDHQQDQIVIKWGVLFPDHWNTQLLVAIVAVGFQKNKGQWELIGICSGIDNDIKQFMNVGYYGQIMEWTRVSVFAKWLMSK